MLMGTMRFGRTFIFVDLSGFTNYTESYGDGAAAQLLAQFVALPVPWVHTKASESTNTWVTV